MSVRDIVDQFTDTNFTLIVHDCGYYGDNIFNGPADDIYDDRRLSGSRYGTTETRL